MLDLRGYCCGKYCWEGLPFKVDLPLLAVEHQPEEVEPPEAPPADFYKPALVWLADDDALIRTWGGSAAYIIFPTSLPNGMALLKA